MIIKNNSHRSHRRERAAKRAFVIWMAGYAAILIAIFVGHSLALYPSTALDIKALHTLQAKITGGPQSSLSAHDAPEWVVAENRG